MKTLILSIGFLIFLVFYFSWKPTPELQESWFMPGWLAKWGNVYHNLRTAVPFVLMGLVAGLYGVKRKKGFRFYGVCLVGMFLIVLVAEVGQLFLPNRHFDVMDIFFGVLGGSVGVAVGYVLCCHPEPVEGGEKGL